MSTPDCTRFEHVQTVFVPFFLSWVLVLVGWCFNTYYKNAASANSMHRMLTWLPAVECLYTFLCIFYYGSCPWESFVSQLVAAALLMVVILKEPLNLLCLLLVAKGWCITRDSLHHGENRIIVVTVVLLYASVVFQLFGNTRACRGSVHLRARARALTRPPRAPLAPPLAPRRLPPVPGAAPHSNLGGAFARAQCSG